MHENDSFVFLTNPRDTQQRGVQDDDVFFNWTTEDTMIMSSSGLPFKAGHKIHLDTFQFLLLALSPLR